MNWPIPDPLWARWSLKLIRRRGIYIFVQDRTRSDQKSLTKKPFHSDWITKQSQFLGRRCPWRRCQTHFYCPRGSSTRSLFRTPSAWVSNTVSLAGCSLCQPQCVSDFPVFSRCPSTTDSGNKAAPLRLQSYHNCHSTLPE